ncbi:uncharacterized protein [Ptychodera flava]|uniref:uncharacterized protein n=1 Tax=Ptychodera flava TaxID=63121 RepID=UPI00396A671C
MIGGSTSDVSIEVAEVLTTLQVSQISYGATSSELSSDDFPFFMRTVPSDVDQAAAIVDVIASLDWRYVSVVFTDNEYGTDMRDKFTAAVRESDICIAMSLLLNVDATTAEFDFVVESLETQVQSRVAILFTSDIQTAKLLQAAEKKGLTDIQWFGTDTWGDRVFIAENATSTSRGAITLQFKRRTSDKFKEYFTSLPAYNNARNPWWSQWYMHHFQCNLNVWGIDKPFDVPCPWNLELSEGFVEEAGVGYVTNAVWAFAKGMHEAMLELCPNKTNHLCHEVVLNPEVLNAKILEAKFKGHGDVDFSFDNYRNGPAEYDILNLQVINNTLQHVKIGEWTSGKLHLNSQQIKTYNSSGQVVPLPTFKCEGRCLECLHVTDAKPKHTELPGKLQIAGLFAVHEQGDHRIECGSIREEGITYVEAMLHAIDVINSNSSILPGITLGATVLDTCSSASQAVRELSPLLSGAYFMSNDRPSSSVPVIAGVVGADTNEVTSSLVQTADSYKYSLVSYGATTSLLSNQAAHPFFLRTVPSDENLSDMLVDVITYFGWPYVSVVRSDDLFKKAAMETFMKKAETSHVCVTTIVEIGTPADYNMAVEKLSNFGDTGAVVLFTNPTDTRNIVQKSASDGKGHLWLFTDDVTQPSFWQGAAPPRDGLSVALGSNTNLQQYLSQLDPRDNERNPWFAQYWRDSFQCNLPGDSEYSKDCDPKLTMPTPGYPLVGYVTTAVNAIAKGMHDLLTTKCGAQAEGMCSDFIAATPEEFLASITEATFSSSDGPFKFTDGHGPAKYEIWKTSQGGQPTKIGSWNNHSLSVPSKPSLPDVPSVPDVDCRTVECALCVQQMFPASTVGASVASKNPVNPPVTQMPVFTTNQKPSPMTDKVTDSKRPPLPPAAQTHRVFRLDGGSIWEIIVLCLTAVGVISSFMALLFYFLNFATQSSESLPGVLTFFFSLESSFCTS